MAKIALFKPECAQIWTVSVYEHNDELFNMYYRTFYELWTFADFDRLCKLGIHVNKQKLI